MEGVSSGSSKNAQGVITGVRVEIDQNQISHVNSLLHSMPDKALTVYRRSITRALTAGKTQAHKEIRERYDIPLASLTQKHSYYTFRSGIKQESDGVIGYINFAGSKIPLYRFHPEPKNRKYTTRYVNGVSGWRITTDVSAADVKGQMLRRHTAFIAAFPSGHTGLFSRFDKKGGKLEKTRTGKDKLRELYGFSVRDMLQYEPAAEAIQERMKKIVEDRINHELLRMLEK